MTQFQAALSHDSNQSKAQKLLAVVHEFPFRTSQELALKVNPEVLDSETIHKRLPELRKRGLVKNGGHRRCTVTRKLAQTWAPASYVL